MGDDDNDNFTTHFTDEEMATPDSEDWKSYQKLVLYEISRLNKNVELLARNQRDIKEDIAVLKYKASAFGVMGGIIVSFAMIVLEKIIGHKI